MLGLARVLLADDDLDIRSAIATRLRADGYEIVETSDGTAALDRIQNEFFDVAILDIMMPGLNGFEVLEQVRAREDPPNIIFLSAAGAHANRLRALYGGAIDFIAKPYDAEELSARVAAAAREHARLMHARADSGIDPLTGLKNRRVFENLIAEVNRAKRFSHPLALVYIDADGLKQMNDTYGHAGGDELLRAIARAIQVTCRQIDMAGRIGGDEFAVILPETDRTGAEHFVDRLLCALTAERVTDVTSGAEIAPAASVGFAILGVDAYETEDLKCAADQSLYKAKKALRRSAGDDVGSRGAS